MPFAVSHQLQEKIFRKNTSYEGVSLRQPSKKLLETIRRKGVKLDSYSIKMYATKVVNLAQISLKKFKVSLSFSVQP